jgi:hypothetical protein
MLRVTVTQKDPGPGEMIEERLLARFVVDEDGVLTDRDEREDRTAVVMMGIPVVDPSTGEQVPAMEQPLRWAVLLPTAFRSGTLEADIEEIEALDGTGFRRVEPYEVTPTREAQHA